MPVHPPLARCRAMAFLKIPKPLSASEAAKARNPKKWRGWVPAEFLDAAAKESQRRRLLQCRVCGAVCITAYRYTKWAVTLAVTALGYAAFWLAALGLAVVLVFNDKNIQWVFALSGDCIPVEGIRVVALAGLAVSLGLAVLFAGCCTETWNARLFVKSS